MKGEILFRQLGSPVVSSSVPGLRWVVEFWVYDMAYPLGQVWVTVTDTLQYLDWMVVDEDNRRKGIGSQLLKACLERWPNMEYDGATDAGEGFVDTFNSREGK